MAVQPVKLWLYELALIQSFAKVKLSSYSGWSLQQELLLTTGCHQASQIIQSFRWQEILKSWHPCTGLCSPYVLCPRHILRLLCELQGQQLHCIIFQIFCAEYDNSNNIGYHNECKAFLQCSYDVRRGLGVLKLPVVQFL